MLTNVKNECAVNGIVYDFGRFGLTEKDGKIYGSVIVLVDEPTETTVEVHFLPQSKVYKTGKENTTYEALKELMDTKKTIAAVGKKDAAKVRCTCKLSTNIYYSAPQGKTELELHEPLQVQGSFLHIDENAVPSVGFNVDALIKSLAPIADANGNATDSYRVNMEIFDDYRKMFRPLTLKLSDPSGIAVFTRNVESPNYYTTISGTMINRVIQAASSAGDMEFGSAAVVSTSRPVRDILITGASAPKEFDMSDEELLAVKNNRNEQLNEAKKRAENAKGSKANVTSATSNTAASVSTASTGFDF